MSGRSPSLHTVVKLELADQLMSLSVVAALRPCMMKLPSPGASVNEPVVCDADVLGDKVELL